MSTASVGKASSSMRPGGPSVIPSMLTVTEPMKQNASKAVAHAKNDPVLIEPHEYVNHTPLEIFRERCHVGQSLRFGLTELACTTTFFFVTTFVGILYNQEYPFAGLMNGLAAASTIFAIQLIGGYTTGAFLNPFYSLVIALQYLIGSRLYTPFRAAKMEPLNKGDFSLKALLVFIQQIGGAFLGVILAAVPFLNESGRIDSAFTYAQPKLGIATWVAPTVVPPSSVTFAALTDYQGAMMEGMGAFGLTFMLLMMTSVRVFHDRPFKQALVRASGVFVLTLLTYSFTGAGFVAGPFRWIVASAYLQNFTSAPNTINSAITYVVAPITGTLGAVVVWFFVWMVVRSATTNSKGEEENKLHRP